MSTTTTSVKHRKDSVSRGMWRSASLGWRVGFALMGLLILLNISILGLSSWYEHKHRNEHLELGVTFIAKYSRHFGLEPTDTLEAILDDLNIRRLRLVSYWNEAESTEGTYNFSQLDQQFRMANMYGAKVTLAIGLRQPRWPECHMPAWALNTPRSSWQPKLERYIAAVIDRYKNNPALESYQLENEYFLKVFGECPDFTRERLVKEFDLAKSLDKDHPVLISRSNNSLGWPVYAPTPDQYGVSVYKRVWDKTITKRYFEYPYPAAYYGALAAVTQITQNRSMIVHELQSEAWGPTDILDLSIEEQNKTMDAEKLKERIDYGVDTGMKKVDLWGVEYWYYRQQKLHDSSLWNAAKQKIAEYNQPVTK